MSAKAIAAQQSGVYSAPEHLDALRKATGKTGPVWFDLPLAAVANKKQFLAACAKQLKLPAHFGGNWDALADCVRDFSWAKSASGYMLHITAADKFAKAAPEDFETAIAVLQEAAEYWKEKGTPFVVFVDGAGDLPAF